MIKTTIAYIIFIKILLSSLILQGHSLDHRSFETGLPLVRNYSAREYNANSQNVCIVQDFQGMIYAGNTDGLLQYDGSTWRMIDISNKSMARSMALDKQGRIYVGAQYEFGYLETDSAGKLCYVSLVKHVAPENCDFVDVWQTWRNKENIYFNAFNCLFRWDQNNMYVWKPKPPFYPGFVVSDTFYIRQRKVGLMKVTGDSLKLLPDGELFADKTVFTMLPFPGKKILIGTFRDGLFLYDGSTIKPFQTQADVFLKKNKLYMPGASLPDSTYAFQTAYGGVAIIDTQGRFIRVLDKSSGLPDNMINYAYHDPQGGLWLATNSGGISRVEIPSPCSCFDQTTGLQGGVLAIKRHLSRLYVLTDAGLYFLDFRKGTELYPPTSYFRQIEGIYNELGEFLSINDRLYLIGHHLFEIQQDQWQERYHFDAASGARTFTQLRKKPNRLIVGLQNGLVCISYLFEENKWINEWSDTDKSVIVDNLAEDSSGVIWAGTRSKGVIRLTCTDAPDQPFIPAVERFDTSNGLPKGLIRIFIIDGQPVFSGEKGLQRFDESSGRFYATNLFGSRFPSSTLSQDPAGNVWISSDEGIRFFFQKNRNSYVPLKTPMDRFKNRYDSIYPEPDGVVWFGNDDGLIRYDQFVPKNINLIFSTLIRKITFGDDSLLFAGNKNSDPVFQQDYKTADRKIKIPDLAYAHNILSFEYTLPAYDHPSENKFQTYLEGLNKTWSQWSDERKKRYAYLPPGKYRFHVRGKDVYGNTAEEATYSFRILPPWYRTWWSYGMYIFIFALGVFVVDRVQRTRLIKHERERTRVQLLEAENRRKSEELEQARQLQLSMLPENLPRLPYIDISVHMETATEVGGDYYDYHLSENKILTLAIGDATGHGLNAGMMVTATKSLFHALAENADILYILNSMNKALKRVKLNKLYMGFQIIRINDHHLEVATAGMPPLLHYSARKRDVREIKIKTLPLGGVFDYPYQKEKIKLSPGDTIMLMSDGFPEQFNPAGEIIDYPRIASIFKNVAHQSPDTIIHYFLEFRNNWANKTPKNDDTTFVVLKITK